MVERIENKKLLVSGGHGFVMSQIVESLRRRGYEITAPSITEMDFTDPIQIKNFVRNSSCDIYLHAGAYVNVKKAKDEFEDAKRINGQGTENSANACEEKGKMMILISTDFVFEGSERNPGPYDENTKPPDSFTSINIGYYGSSKLLSEKIATEKCSKLAIVRISYPFGNINDRDYLMKLDAMIRSGKTLWVDQHITPTYLPDLEIALEKIIANEMTGTFHVACTSTTPYEIGSYLRDKVGLGIDIHQGYFQNPSRDVLPQFGGLKTDITQERLGIKFHTWQEAVDEYLKIILPLTS